MESSGVGCSSLQEWNAVEWSEAEWSGAECRQTFLQGSLPVCLLCRLPQSPEAGAWPPRGYLNSDLAFQHGARDEAVGCEQFAAGNEDQHQRGTEDRALQDQHRSRGHHLQGDGIEVQCWGARDLALLKGSSGIVGASV